MPKRKATCRAWVDLPTKATKWLPVWTYLLVGEEVYVRKDDGVWRRRGVGPCCECVVELSPREARKLDAERRAAK